MFKRLAHALMLLTLLLAMGGQWAALQTLAWTTMLAQNLRSASLSEAINRTFDGKHPCRLCKAVATGSQKNPKTEFVSISLKLEFPPQQENISCTCRNPVTSSPAGKNLFAEARSEEPATPPPRRFAA